MKHSLAVLATIAAGFAAAPAASAAEFSISPVKPCYGSGERVTLAGSGFTPLGDVMVRKDGEPLGTIASDATGAFSGAGLTVKLADGRQRRTYSADTAVIGQDEQDIRFRRGVRDGQEREEEREAESHGFSRAASASWPPGSRCLW